MSYDFQNNNQGNQGGERPGFSAAPASQDFGGGAPQQASGGGYGGQSQNGGGYNGGGGNSNSGGGNSGYSSSNGGGGSGGGWKGNSGGNGGGGWKAPQGGGGYSRPGGQGGGGGWKGGQGGGGRGAFNKVQLSPEELANLPLPKSAVMAGNFRAPEQLAPVVREMGELLRQHKFVVRAGGMDGFDKIVADNVQGCEFHIPWKEFGQISNAASSFNSDECKEYAKRYLPDWGNLKESHQAFFCKNARLVLGKSLKQPAQIAIIWSEDGVEGPANRTQQSMHAGHIAAICKAMNIPVINISNPDAVQRLRRFLEA